MAATSGCQAALSAYCAQNCPLSAQFNLIAVYDYSIKMESGGKAWRCYAETSLDYKGVYRGEDKNYCTRHAPLKTIADSCESSMKQRHVEIAADGTASLSKVDTPSPTLKEANLTQWTFSEDEEVTIAAVDTETWKPTAEAELHRVLAWELPCIDSLDQHTLRNRTGNVSRRKAFLSREGLQCHGRCVRGVVDGFATHEEIAELMTIRPGPPGSKDGNIKQWRWKIDNTGNTPNNVVDVYQTLVSRAQSVLEEQYGIQNLRFYRSNMITWEGKDLVKETEWPSHAEKWRPKALHGDTNTDEMFIFTTILYLSQHGKDVRGGETGIADVVVDDQGGLVRAGLRVQPSVGRLLVFSSGPENMHEMLAVTHGRRVAIQMWFACEGMDPGWAYPQRVAWEAEHGYGGPDVQGQPGVVNRPQKSPPRTPMPPAWPWRKAKWP
jgi:Rps23 Pro-64 3,4-dihydroxylase Tpa1-like proline 4-hydroxylase